MDDFLELWLRLAAALGIGLLVGGERERRGKTEPVSRYGGIRTFALTAILGAISYHLGEVPLLAVSALCIAGLSSLGLVRGPATGVSMLSEIALLLTLLLGALAMRDPVLASGLGVTVAILLIASTRLHNFASSVITDQELHDGLVLAGAALVIMPLMPNRAMGPFNAINPYALWTIVVLMLGMRTAGHVALRTFGPRFGLPLAGLLSGFVSSALTVSAMGAKSRERPALLESAVAGALFSSLSTAIQMALIVGATSAATLRAVAVPLCVSGAVAALYAVYHMTLHKATETEAPSSNNASAFGIGAALAVTAMISVVMLLSAALYAWSGRAGLLASVAVAGFADAHAPGIAVASLVAAGKLSAAESMLPVLLAMSSNVVSKVVLASVSGGWQFSRRASPGLLLSLAGAWLAALVMP